MPKLQGHALAVEVNRIDATLAELERWRKVGERLHEIGDAGGTLDSHELVMLARYGRGLGIEPADD